MKLGSTLALPLLAPLRKASGISSPGFPAAAMLLPPICGRAMQAPLARYVADIAQAEGLLRRSRLLAGPEKAARLAAMFADGNRPHG